MKFSKLERIGLTLAIIAIVGLIGGPITAGIWGIKALAYAQAVLGVDLIFAFIFALHLVWRKE